MEVRWQVEYATGTTPTQSTVIDVDDIASRCSSSENARNMIYAAICGDINLTKLTTHNLDEIVNAIMARKAAMKAEDNSD